MNLPLDFNSAEPWTRNRQDRVDHRGSVRDRGGRSLREGKFPGRRRPARVRAGILHRAATCSARGDGRGRTSSGEFSLDRFSAVGLAERIVVVRSASIPKNTAIVQLVGRPGTPNIEVMIDDIDTARAFAEELGATLNLELQSVAVPGQTIRRYTV